MATPMTASQIVSQLKKWGIKYAEYKSWETHNRNHMGKWGPVHGFMVHHTGSDSKDQRELLYSGISGLPGPLCHFGLAQDGTVHLVGWGRANHAGSGDPDVLNAVVNENYGANPPVDNESSVDGNARFYGVEIWYSGSHAMTSAQYATLRKLAAAICDFHGWSEKSVIGHGEWGSPGKWDPGISSGKMMNMAEVRADIKATLGGSKEPDPVPSKPSGSESTHTVVKGETLWSIAEKYKVSVDNLKKWNNLKSDVLDIGQKLQVKAPSTGGGTVATKTAGYKEVWDLDVATPPKGHETKENPTWAPMSILRGIYEKLDDVQKRLDAIEKKLGV
ncbi:LysM-like peptidoglycan-binding protein [Streptomyces phage StarPlatinum]|uniref:LysM-like peptidoglycan binding protein n=1 Tax=Streptomyces phage StarPlatinum TaxID=2283265 RepID=A0A345M8H2_9CAUD|nr:endolysin [Streptomyces phage StarPlatinum]AXH66793.1 LysM-like peptidoglycan-binding protein [Streptomyces phage StarPlatinum]